MVVDHDHRLLVAVAAVEDLRAEGGSVGVGPPGPVLPVEEDPPAEVVDPGLGDHMSAAEALVVAVLVEPDPAGGHLEGVEGLGEDDRVLHTREPLPAGGPVQNREGVWVADVGVGVPPRPVDPGEGRAGGVPRRPHRRGQPGGQLPRAAIGLDLQDQPQPRAAGRPREQLHPRRGHRAAQVGGQGPPPRVAAEGLGEQVPEQGRLAEPRRGRRGEQFHPLPGAAGPVEGDRDRRRPQERPELAVGLQPQPEPDQLRPPLPRHGVLPHRPQPIQPRIRHHPFLPPTGAPTTSLIEPPRGPFSSASSPRPAVEQRSDRRQTP